MKHLLFDNLPKRVPRALVRRLSKNGIAAVQAILIGLSAATVTGQGVDGAIDDEGAEVLTRGPVHEAFAGIVTYNPEPGVIVAMAPPTMIEEMPPESRPTGDNISWIPGYWGWDDERSDYLWISGTWRALPPGRQWTTGYWASSGQGHQWISGYWADSSLRETTYLPRPPITVEVGPNTHAPSHDHSWTPGSWTWHQERYAWRPGYWAEGRADWDWIPANYVWTPRGYIFVDGYWDYSFDRRGVLYAPVYIQSRHYSRPNYSYSPVVAIGLVAMMEHLFLRPNYHHYYFGDYYERRYRNNGFYSPYAYQSSRHGYDPVYSHRRWTHRDDRDWERRYEASYDYRRDHESARPPRTWAEQKSRRMDTVESREQQHFMATSLDQMAQREGRPMRIEQVPEKERQRYTDLSRDVRKSRDQRRELETDGENNLRGNIDREIKPSKSPLPESPIVGRSPDRFEEKQAPPKPHGSPIGNPGKDRSERNPEANKDRPEVRDQPERRDADPRREQPTPPREVVPNRDKPVLPPEPRAEKPTREEPQVREPKRETREEPRVREPKREPRQEPQVREPKRETRKQPEAREPKREIVEQPRRIEEKPPEKARQESKPRESDKRDTDRPPSGKNSERDKEESEQSNDRKKERNKQQQP